MKHNIAQLVRIGGLSLGPDYISEGSSDFIDYGQLGREFISLFSEKNGFYAFESALHIFPLLSETNCMTLARWNSNELWRYEYGTLAQGLLFFAEDAFGNQFCLHGEEICSFHAETGEIKTLDYTLDDWSARILAEYEVLTGYPLLHLWQSVNGAIPIGKRLMPKIPFVLGGDYSVENVYAIETVSGMKSRGNLAQQIKNLPDGMQVDFRIID
jgi:hypothetical protein